MSLNPAWLNNCLKVSTFAKAKGFGVPGGGAGTFSSFLTVVRAKSATGTLEGADHTAAQSLPFVINICLILSKAAGRFGKNIRPNLERIASNFDIDGSGSSNFSPSLSLNTIILSKPSDLALVFAIANIFGEISIATTLPFGITFLLR